MFKTDNWNLVDKVSVNQKTVDIIYYWKYMPEVHDDLHKKVLDMFDNAIDKIIYHEPMKRWYPSSFHDWFIVLGKPFLWTYSHKVVIEVSPTMWYIEIVKTLDIGNQKTILV